MTDATLTQDEIDFEAAFEKAAQKRQPTKQEPKDEPLPQGDDGEGEGSQEPEAQAPEPKAAKVDDPPKSEPDTVESLRAQLQELHHKERSSASRVSVFMRESNQLKERVSQLEGENAALKAKLASASTDKAPAKPASKDGPDDVLDGAPDLKAAVESRIQSAIESATRALREELDAANTKLAEVGQQASEAARQIEPLASREEARAVESVRGQLDKLFPQWRADVGSGAVQSWLETQHESIKALFPGKGLADSSTVLKLFYADKGASSAPKPEGDGDGAASRERLRRAAGIAPGTAIRHTPDKNDFEGAFEEFAAKRRR